MIKLFPMRTSRRPALLLSFLMLVEALLTCSVLFAGTGQQTPVQALETAQTFERRQEYPQAIVAYREYLRLHPENDEARGTLAKLLSWEGMYDEAISLYRDILTRHPLDLEVRTALARNLSWQKQFDEAQAIYDEVLREDPKNFDAKKGRADVAFWRGDRKKALSLYESIFAETKDPEVQRKIQSVKAELVASLHAPIGQGLTGLRLPYRDYAKIGYGHYTYTNNRPDERNLLFEVAKPIGDQTLVVRVEPINRFGFTDTPVAAEYYSPLWQRAWGYVAAQGTMNPHFAPNYSFVGEVAQALGGLHSSLAPFEMSFGYRHLNYKTVDIDLFLPGVTVYLPLNLWLTEKVYIVPNTGAITLSSQLTWRPTDRLQLFASGSFGTSGERIIATQDFTRVASHTIQGGVIFPITDRFSAEAVGYYEDRGFLYIRRGGSLSLIYHW